MKRFQVFLFSAFIAFGSVFAQSADADWKGEVAKIKELIQNNPTQAAEQAEQLVKGKNKKNIDLLLAVGQIYLDANNTKEAQKYATLARKANSKSPQVSVFEGDIAVVLKDAGLACQKYDEAIYFDAKHIAAYISYANIYKSANPNEAINKLNQLLVIDPSNLKAQRLLAEIYYLKNEFKKAVSAYEQFANDHSITEEDLVKYAFALFLNGNFEKSLEISNLGLKKDSHHAAFNRLAMYNNTDLKRYDEGLKVADVFFNVCDKADYSYLDYIYYGHLFAAVKKYDDAIVQYEKAVKLDPTKTNINKEISDAYEQKSDYKNAIDNYKKYFAALPAELQTPDLKFQLGRLYYAEGTQKNANSEALTPECKAALLQADSIFSVIAIESPDSYLGDFWRARSNSALDPETTKGLAKPYYEKVAALLESKNDPRYKSNIVECYSYLGYFHLLANELQKSKDYWNKILVIDPNNATAKQALQGIKL